MTSWLLRRMGWLLLTLLGVTFVTFFVLDRAPIDRAELEADRLSQSSAEVGSAITSDAERAEAVRGLRIRYGMIDAETGKPAPLWRRYFAWLGNAMTLQLAGPGEDQAAFWRRLAEAAPVTLLLGLLGLGIAFGAGLPFGVWVGRRAGRRSESLCSGALLAGIAVPEFLMATLLLLLLSSAWLQWFPASGLRSIGARDFAFIWQVLDFVWHLILPVFVLSVGPFVMVSRFVRDAVVRTERAPFLANLRALGMPEREIGRRLMRHGSTPVATLAGGLLPMVVGGSIVVENLFSLDGLGHLAFQAVLDQDQAMVMALVLLTSVVTLMALLVSDFLHRLVDPRVRLHA
ncbi:MAG: ABC transporter permease [Planctomycetota bacterium]